MGVKRGEVEWDKDCSPFINICAPSLSFPFPLLPSPSPSSCPELFLRVPNSLSEGANMLSGIESEIFRGMFRRGVFRGIERGAPLKEAHP